MKQEHSISLPENNQEWLSQTEMAKLLNIAQSTLSMFLSSNPDLKERFSKPYGKRVLLSKEFMPYYIARKGLHNTSNQIHEDNLKNAKDKMIDMARDNNALSVVMSRLDMLEKAFTKLQLNKQANELSLELLPEPTKEVPEMNLRAALNKYVRDKARQQNRNYNIVFNELYSQFYYRYGINITARAKKKNMSMIEYAEEYNHLEDLYALARKLYK